MSLIKLSLCFAVLVSAQVCLAGPTTTPAPFTIASFSEVIANAQKSINDATTHIQHMLGLPDVKNVDQIVGALKNSSTAFSKSINDVITSVKVEGLAPIQKQTEGLFKNLTQSFKDIQKDLSRYNASAGTDLVLQTVDAFVAKAKAQLDKEREILSKVEFTQFQNMVLNTSANIFKQGHKSYDELRKKVDPNAKAAAAAFQKFFDQVNKTTEEFRKKIPELQVSDLEKTWTKSLNSIVDEGTKLKTALEKEAPHAQESLTKAVQNILETASKTANSFAEQVHETVGHNKHPDHAAHHKA